MPKPISKVVTVDQFQSWFDSLNDLDRSNFRTLINLPSVLDVLVRMPEGQYREMVVFGIALLKAVEKNQGA